MPTMAKNEMPVRLSEETQEQLRAGATLCADCGTILLHLKENRLVPARRPDGSTFSVAEQKRHIMELKGLAVSEKGRALLEERAGTCRRPNGSGCFFCARILDALSSDGTLRVWPADKKDEQVKISVDAQIGHMMLERGEPVEWIEVPA